MARRVDSDSHPEVLLPGISAVAQAAKALQQSLDPLRYIGPALRLEARWAQTIRVAASAEKIFGSMTAAVEQHRRLMQDQMGAFHQLAEQLRQQQAPFERALAMVRETTVLHTLAPAFDRIAEAARLVSVPIAVGKVESDICARLTAAASARQCRASGFGVLAQLSIPPSIAGSAIIWPEMLDTPEAGLPLTHADLWVQPPDLERRDTATLIVEVRVECYRCGGPILAEGTTLEAPAGSDLRGRLRVAPFCVTCLDNWDGSGDYLFPPPASPPRFTVLPGQNLGDGRPAVKSLLRVVKLEEE